MSTSINKRFLPLSYYQSLRGSSYSLLPFRFIELDVGRYALTNIVGEQVVTSSQLLHAFVRHQLDVNVPLYDELKSKHFLLDGDSSIAVELLAAKYRTKTQFLANFTSLHLFVVTLRCDHSCPYCQVSRQSEDKTAFDMSKSTAAHAIDFMFKSPSPALKVEFQGGESLMNFELIEFITLEVEERNKIEKRDVQFVIATNLAPLSDEHLDFCRDHSIFISTSLDGPRELHNKNRPRPGGDSFQRAVDGIHRVRQRLGRDKVSALMTTTESSLSQPMAIIDEYVRQGFSSIFLRPISPYGFAIKTRAAEKYKMDEWLAFYKSGLDYIISINQQGLFFREEYASLILRKMLTPWSTGYVDLQSPAGAGISAIVFNYDGYIYPSDEARMLAEMNDTAFRLGKLGQSSYEQVMLSDTLVTMITDTMTESVPCCSDCGFQPYCGSDPIYHYRTQGDWIGLKPLSGFCTKNMEITRHLIRILEDDSGKADILRSWLR